MEIKVMKKSSEEQRRRCLDGVVNLWAETGKAFTMSELATYLKMSKKTLYVLFEDKEEMILSAIDQWFDKVKAAKMQILSDPDLTTVEKVRRVMIVQPEGYGPVATSSFTEFLSEHPRIHRHIIKRLQSGWEPIIELLVRGMEKGELRRVNIYILRTIIEGAFEKLLSSTEATKEWERSLEEMMDLIIGGLEPRGEGQ